jgi:hypothetical protein
MLRFFATALSVFLGISLAFAQPGQLEAKILNYADASAIRQLNKLELGIRLPNQIGVRVNNFVKETRVSPSEKINPFLAWELDVEAKFVHIETGTAKVVPAFYYREYERDPATDSWVDVGTDHPMRIRFAPSLPGKWRCTISVKVKGKPLDEHPVLDFTVVKSDNKGFVTVHPNKRNLQLNGQMIYPVGTNFPSPTKGVNNYHTAGYGMADHFSPAETHSVTKLKDWMRYHEDIEAYSNQGGKYIRTLQSGWSSLLEFEKKGNYYDRQPYAWEQDRLLEFCEQNGVYVHFNLMQQEPFMKYGNYDMFDWDWSHYSGDKSYFKQDIFPAYCYANGDKKEPHETMLLEDDLRYHEQRTRYYIARYGYSTSIYLFELMSEPWHVDQFGGHEELSMNDDALGDTIRKAMRNYHERLAVYIKETLGHTNQLIGIDLFMARFYDGEKFLDQSIYHPAIDVISFNHYTSYPDKMIIAKSSDNNLVLDNENSMARMVLALNRKTGKPILLAEGGAGDGVDDCSNFAQQYVDMMTFGFTGLAGYNSWVGWSNGQERSWPVTIAAQQFMNGTPVTGTLGNADGLWIQGRQAERNLPRDPKKGKELQYYIASDRQSAAGYVKNRSFNFLTKSDGPNCAKASFELPFLQLTDMEWDAGNKPLTVEGLSSGNYEITWYDFKTGEVVTTQCQKARRGKMKLHFPILTVTEGKPERPVLWFTMVKKEC